MQQRHLYGLVDELPGSIAGLMARPGLQAPSDVPGDPAPSGAGGAWAELLSPGDGRAEKPIGTKTRSPSPLESRMILDADDEDLADHS